MQAGLDSKNGLTSGKANITGSLRDFVTATTYNWFFGIQNALSNNWVVEANYVGSSGHNEYGAFDVNRFNGDLITNSGVLKRLNSSFGVINLIEPRFTSFYTGGNASVKGRASHGLTLQAAYTFGKAIDMISATTTGFADPTNLGRERGLANFDVRQKLAVFLMWELPKHHFSATVLNGLLGGWQIGDVTILQGGTPFSVTCSSPFAAVRNASGVITGNSGCDFNADGNNFDYPNVPSFGNSKSGSRLDFIRGLFTAADFPKPALGQEGNLGRNTFRGPGFANTEINVLKDFKIPVGEATRLQFRCDIFNLFNRVNLAGIHANLADTLLGKSTSSFGARDIQFALRLSF